MREKQLVRLLKTVDLLARPEGATINELCEKIGTDRRSVYRIIETLQSMKFPVYDDKTPDEAAMTLRNIPVTPTVSYFISLWATAMTSNEVMKELGYINE